jgi:hypothetical protein
MNTRVDQQVEAANKKLSRLKIRNKGNKLYLRGTLPPKPSDGILPRQYELSTGLPFTQEGIKVALARAQEIESRLILEKLKKYHLMVLRHLYIWLILQMIRLLN